MEFAREVGVTQRGVGVTLDRISALIKTKPEQEDPTPGKSTVTKIQRCDPECRPRLLARGR